MKSLLCFVVDFSSVLHVGSMNKSDVWNRWNQTEAFINERLHGELREHSPHCHSFTILFCPAAAGTWKLDKTQEDKVIMKGTRVRLSGCCSFPSTMLQTSTPSCISDKHRTKKASACSKSVSLFFSFPITVKIFWRDTQFHVVLRNFKYPAKQIQKDSLTWVELFRGFVIRKWTASNGVQSLLVADVSQLGNQERLLLILLLMATEWF